MKPYEENYILGKINEYNSYINENKIGEFEILKRDCLKGIISGYMYEKEGELDSKIPELSNGEKVLMRLDAREIQGTYEAINRATGKVGIVGLGLGYTVQEMAKKKDVKQITVYEISEDVIELYNKNFKPNRKIRIIQGDAYKVRRRTFDFFFVDIYEYKLTDKVVEDYKFFIKKHNIKEYSFFGMEHFLLSCRYEEIVWVYIPENWMEMAKEMSKILDESSYINYYKKLDEDLVSDVLAKFKEVLNEDEDE